MINPKIFHYFKKALKWEIIIICASFAYIMPWQSANAAGIIVSGSIPFYKADDSEFRNAFAQFYKPDGSVYPRSDLCKIGSSSRNYYEGTMYDGTRYGYCALSPSNTHHFPDGYRIDPNSDTTNNPFPTPAPDIQSCTLTELSAPGATSIPTQTRIDGCIYEFQGVGICTSSTCHWEVSPSGTYPPGEFPECTQSEPCPVPGSGESSPGPSQQQDEQIAFIDDILNTNGDIFGRPNGDIVWTHNPPGCDIVITIKPDGTRSDSFEGDQCQTWEDAYNNPHSNPDDPDGDCAGLPCDGDGGTGGDGGDDGDGGDGGTGGNNGGGTGGDGGDGGTGGDNGGGTGGDGGDDGDGGDGGTGGDNGGGTGGDGGDECLEGEECEGDGEGTGEGDGEGDGDGPGTGGGGDGDGEGTGTGGDCEDEPEKCAILEEIRDSLTYEDDTGAADQAQIDFDNNLTEAESELDAMVDEDIEIEGLNTSAILELFNFPQSPEIRHDFSLTIPALPPLIKQPKTFEIKDVYTNLEPLRELEAYTLYLSTLAYILYLFFGSSRRA